MATKLKNIDRVTVIGLGNMGSALAEKLLATGHAVSVWNRTEAKCRPFVELGADVANNPVEAMKVSDTIIICVLDIEAVKSILLSDGVAEALDGKTVIQLSALEPEQSREQNEWMREHCVRYLDGGILAFPAYVRQGTAKIAYSGSKSAFEDANTILESFGENPVFIGEHVGMAPLAAMLVYAQYYGITFACLHTAAMAAKAGITLETLP